ncbi:hypothetical protein LTR36_010056 [Oleoguttula mirabilis]|uniref:Uncharacterized protein n=1 Tax=Oleoguttula mirabilis TaxID=1507867 RepID=A0AAV9JRN8_9PEZI|nr:hypothetical protein LTR36_010056 [Oleoguttula mirabilis]
MVEYTPDPIGFASSEALQTVATKRRRDTDNRTPAPSKKRQRPDGEQSRPRLKLTMGKRPASPTADETRPRKKARPKSRVGKAGGTTGTVEVTAKTKQIRASTGDKASKRMKIKLTEATKLKEAMSEKKKKKKKNTGVVTAVESKRKRTWIILHYDPDKPASPLNINLGGFYSATDHYGGPLAFLSNSFPSKIRDPHIHKTHVLLKLSLRCEEYSL